MHTFKTNFIANEERYFFYSDYMRKTKQKYPPPKKKKKNKNKTISYT